MKKLAWMLALAMPFAIASCGDDDPTDITLDATSITLDYGTEKALTASEKNCTWGSDNEFVATVDKDGKVEAKHVGTATITVTKDGASASCKVNVVPTNTNFTLPILNWGASAATVMETVGKDIVPDLNTLQNNNGEIGYMSKVEGSGGMPIYTYTFVNDALIGSGLTVSQEMSSTDNLKGFLEQYFILEKTNDEEFTFTYINGLNRIDASIEATYGIDNELDIFVNFLPITHTKAASNHNVREVLKAASSQMKKK